MNFIKDFKRFYPSYLKAHSNPTNRLLHFIGASLFFGSVALAFAFKAWWLIVLGVIIGYLLPGLGHQHFEHNKSFRASKPIFCVLGALLVYWYTLTFQIGKKLKTII